MNKNNQKKISKHIEITSSFEIFKISVSKTVGFPEYIGKMVSFIDKGHKIAKKTLNKINTVLEEETDEKYDEGSDHPAKEEFRFYYDTISEIVLCRVVEAFQNYLASILEEVLKACPSILKSSETVKVDEILKYNNLDDFIHSLIKKKVLSLAYSSFEDLNKYFSDYLGIEIIDEDSSPIIREAIEVRNISVHNNCIINEKYVLRMQGSSDLLGKKRELSANFIGDSISTMEKIAKKVDGLLIKKFKLKNKKISIK